MAIFHSFKKLTVIKVGSALNWSNYALEIISLNYNCLFVSGLELCNEDGCEWNAPQKLNVQTLEWNLPITIYPADPVHVEWVRRCGPTAHKISVKPGQINV